MRTQSPDLIKCKKCGHPKKYHTHPDHPVVGNDEYSYTYGMKLWCLPEYPYKGGSCGCDGFVDPRPLSLKQKAALVRMLDPHWIPPRGNGRVVHGFRQTLYSLKDRDLVDLVRYGFLLTECGRKLALELKKKNDPAVIRESRR